MKINPTIYLKAAKRIASGKNYHPCAAIGEASGCHWFAELQEMDAFVDLFYRALPMRIFSEESKHVKQIALLLMYQIAKDMQ